MGKQGCAAVVGFGASAGGLEALEQIFPGLPADTGMAFVVVTHTHAGQQSLLPEILGRLTAMPVVVVDRSQPLAPDHVYLPVPGKSVVLRSGRLYPWQPGPKAPVPLPIDACFRSLADDQGESAVGVILSGTGSDGTVGVSAIKAALGLVIVQDEATASFGGMPHSAIASGAADQVLPPSRIPAALTSWVGRTLGKPDGREAAGDVFASIFELLRDRTGHDFSSYKQSTIQRRIERRIQHPVQNLTRLGVRPAAAPAAAGDRRSVPRAADRRDVVLP